MSNVFSEWDVVNYVKSIHHTERDFIEGDIIERIEEYDIYELIEVKVSDLEMPCFYVDEDLIEEYKELDNQTIPPLVLGYYDNGKYMTIDGTHRTIILKELGIESVMAYVGIRN